MDDGLRYKIAFSRLPGVTIADVETVCDTIGSCQAFFDDPRSLPHTFTDEALEKALTDAQRIIADIEQHHISAIAFDEPRYPERLANCPDAPIILYTCGNADFNVKHVVSVVGTRHATPYGRNFVNDLVSRLADKLDSLLIVSGLAAGIDIAAHSAAVSAHIPTVGILAHGLDHIYPSEHRRFASQLIERKCGALITEYPYNAAIHKSNFLARNRIIAGMSDAVVIAESAVKGGALSTARFARAYDREVLALPGRRTDIYSAGCNHLIASNLGRMIQSANDLIDIMNWKAKKTADASPTIPMLTLTDDEQTVIDYITAHGDSQMRDISRALKTPLHKATALLVSMEMRRLIVKMPGSLYSLAK